MFRNHLKAAYRSLRRHAGTTAITIVGLSVGIAVSVLLLLFARSELAVNDVFPNAERIVRLDSEWDDPDRGLRFLTSAPAGAKMVETFPEVKAQTRMYGIAGTVGSGTDFYRRSTWLVDPSFTDVFSLPLRHGTWEGALDDPRSAVLHEEAARTIFGTTDVVGRSLDVRTWQRGIQSYTVTGVWEDLPDNSITGFRADHYQVLLGETGTWDFTTEAGFTDWRSIYIMQYVKLAEGTSVASLQEKLAGFVDTYAHADIRGAMDIVLNPLTEVYLTDPSGGDMGAENQGWMRIYTLAVLAGLILLIAGINFTNLATARSLDRTREIGVRKALGAHRGQLARQFLVEAVLVSTVATLGGALLAHVAIPHFSRLVGVEFVLSQPWDGLTGGALAALAVIVGLGAGAYPAAVLSGFEPVAVLRDRLSLGWSAGALRKGLVVTQFVLAIVLMSGVYVVHEQVQFALDRELPFPADRIVTIESAPRDFSEAGYRAIQTVRDQMEAQGFVDAATVSWDIPDATRTPGASGAAIRLPEWPDDRTLQTDRLRVDNHFAATFDLAVIKGRFFREPMADDAGTVVVNEAAVQALGLDDPLGQTIASDGFGQDLRIIGVVRDFNRQNARVGTAPLILTPVVPGGIFRMVSVKVAPDAENVMPRIREVWDAALPQAPFMYTFMDDRIAEGYAAEQQTQRLVGVGAGLALFVALLGLVGLTGFTVRRRTKEIGLRKALGASVANIVRLLSADVATLVAIAFLVGAPAGYAGAQWWLHGFALRIDLAPWPFAGVGLVAMLCALAAVSVHTLRAAHTDPAQTLQEE